ncbi:CrcB family protein [Lentilactobacillus parafarraginis]|uniref:Fluoride-specific ion channel FluC n=3 Tax=Lentilactobacillus parafarraginis TaxID=390842 RepID=A0A0R1YZN1_9LACO|nr:CrcB family protein [Lentilactobacillus parafarraginis]KRM44950.1 camphor resistance protein CrcB2 [Lentilactobacillus parafarraginis DSM 18390 = JCM 14109]TLQ18654.1 CrcB family protein [Lentilactobacillus parafarraginis]
MKVNWYKVLQFGAVFVGGMIGGIGRYEVGLWVNSNSLLATTVVNIVGCFLLTFNIYGLDLVIDLPNWLILGFGTGVVGAFTTFSTFALLVVQQMQQPLVATGFLILNLVGGFFTALLGYGAARLMDRGKRVW